jgi:hypothetical protein
LPPSALPKIQSLEAQGLYNETVKWYVIARGAANATLVQINKGNSVFCINEANRCGCCFK